MITITELEDEIIKNKEAANVFIEKIKCHKNRVGGTYSKHLPPLYSENIQFTSYLQQQPVPL